MRYEITHRYTGAVLYAGDGASLADVVAAAVKVGVDLSSADLRGADMHGADLSGADMIGADMCGADMSAANLSGADMSDACLYGANMCYADLRAANMRGADLSGADLSGADLSGVNLDNADLSSADLSGADLSGANLDNADLSGANLRDADLDGAVQVGNLDDDYYRKRAERFRRRNPDIPIIPHLDSQILNIIDAGEGQLEMNQWHSCKTTHCRAGWAITLAGEKGKRLEEKYGPYRAGRMIYLASTGRAPDFFASTECALEDIRKWARRNKENEKTRQ